MKNLRYITLAGNTLFILWILHNAIDEGFRGTNSVEAASLTALIILLVLNSYILLAKK